MADPFTAMAAVGGGLNLAGGLLKASGEADAGSAKSAEYTYRAGLARRNAQINRQNSDYALEAGDLNAERSGLTTGFTIGKQRVAQASNGFDVNTGTAADVRESTRDIGVIDQNTIRTNAGRQALSFRNTASGLDAEANLDMMAAANAKKAGQTSALATLIGTAGSVASKWTQASQVFKSGGGSSGVTLYDENQQASGYLA